LILERPDSETRPREHGGSGAASLKAGVARPPRRPRRAGVQQPAPADSAGQRSQEAGGALSIQGGLESEA